MLIRKFSKKVFTTLLALLFLNPAHAAAPHCENVFYDPVIKTGGVNFGLRSEQSPAPTPEELLKYKEIKAELWKKINTLHLQKRGEIEHLLAAVEFFDYNHTADSLLKNFLENKKQTFNFSKIYDRRNYESTEAAPYKGFINARDNFLRKEKPPLTAELLGEIHKRIMENGVEGVAKEKLGQWRDGHWLGNATGTTGITPQELAAINENPYLIFSEFRQGPGRLNEDIWGKIKIWGSKKNMVLGSDDHILIEGEIHYPFVLTPKQETVDLIKKSHPAVYNEIMAYRESHNLGLRHSKVAKELEQAFTKALVEERFARFNKERAAIGQVHIGSNESAFIDIVADFQRDLVAIHPLLNGNGRTTRLLMNYLLTQEGLPPVRLVDPALDVQLSRNEWREYVHKGVVNSAQLQKDILNRLQQGLTIEHSPELLYPGLPEMVSISLKKQGSNKELPNYLLTKVQSEQFNAFIKTLFEMHPELWQEITNDRLRAMSRIASLFVEYYRSKTIRYIHNKDGEGEIGIRLIDSDFIDQFARTRAYSKELWQTKIHRWYDTGMLVWRGLADKNKEFGRRELIDYFKRPTSHLTSNNVSKQMRLGLPMEKAIINDFKLYNKEAITGELVDMAIDHHRTGPRYGSSYGFSSSKREVVGKAFAMGAMVVGEYGQHKSPELQARLKSRINVAFYRAHKDVDLGRLKAFDADFSYIYGRQAEVMAIGGTDPDAVMLIQRLDAQGEVIETLLRDFENPSEILVIEGRYVPGEVPLPVSKIIERLYL